jgi:hypothetical protein
MRGKSQIKHQSAESDILSRFWAIPHADAYGAGMGTGLFTATPPRRGGSGVSVAIPIAGKFSKPHSCSKIRSDFNPVFSLIF